jgi:magnesium-transporting ATPase (P-type)
MCPKQTKDLQEAHFSQARGDIDCDSPNEYLDSWEGNISFRNDKFSVSIKNMGLRGTTLRNTQFILGYVIYTGHSTKIMKNSKNPPSKMSGVLRKMNTILYSVFILQGFIIITFASASVNWQDKNSAAHYYINLVEFSKND